MGNFIRTRQVETPVVEDLISLNLSVNQVR